MTNHLVRLYAAAASIIVFFLLWTLVAAHPWEATSAAPLDPRLTVLISITEYTLSWPAAPAPS